MNDLIRKLALDAHLLNYIDLETPRHYFVSGSAEEDEVHDFAKLIIYDFLSELTNDDSLGDARIETIKRLAEKWGVNRNECE